MFTALMIASSLVAAPTCVATDGGFDWGFKESFRAYLSGSIANGGWSTEGDIRYETPVFTSDAATGRVDLGGLRGELTVDGTMRFTGHDRILDTTLSNLRLVLLDDDRFEIVVDLQGTTQDLVEKDVPDVRFVTGDLASGVWTASERGLLIADIPVTLTEEGAEAFGTYPAGEAFDAIDLRLSTTRDCAEQAVAARQHGLMSFTPLLVGAIVLAALGASVAVHLWRRSASRRLRRSTD